ncbi:MULTISPECIES: hypothetical protein [Actinomycetes]|uniref:Uncharacterized protein n=1 Tax=Herbiconiux daphne TaxID=2970914 RepID=A0ABT2H982_9MICO|nr:hypothetical protein [Herbiconiux daphne]MCS5736503.1 hypothetical protein [Herbiconiux daphne]
MKRELFLVKNRTVIGEGIQTVDETKVVDFNNMRIDGYVDGKVTTLPTKEEVINIALGFRNIVETVK